MKEEIKFPMIQKVIIRPLKDDERDYKIGDYRLIPKGVEIWSIKNQESFVLCRDVIIKINNIGRDNHYCFVSFSSK